MSIEELRSKGTQALRIFHPSPIVYLLAGKIVAAILFCFGWEIACRSSCYQLLPSRSKVIKGESSAAQMDKKGGAALMIKCLGAAAFVYTEASNR